MEIDTVKARIALESENGWFYQQPGWNRPFRDMTVMELKNTITKYSQRIENSLSDIKTLPQELMELKAELGSRDVEIRRA